jgi:hypothetical protein
VKTKLAGGWYSQKGRQNIYFRIAQKCIPDCIFWAQKFTNHPDIQSILEDERTENIGEADGDSDSDSSTSSDSSDTSDSSASNAALRQRPPAKKRKKA